MRMVSSFVVDIVRLIFISLLELSNNDACLRTIPGDDLTGSNGFSATTKKSTTSTTPSTTTTPAGCLIGTEPYGAFNPAPGTFIPDASTVILTCNPSAHTAISAVLTAICSNGVISPTSTCLPCPDDTWVFDSTTSRCFKAFPAIPTNPCDVTVPCVGVGFPYGVPGGIAYTMNFQALIDATIVALASPAPPGMFNVFYVGITDPLNNFEYVLADGSAVPPASIQPFFAPFQPNDGHFYVCSRFLSGEIAFDDDYCFSGTQGSICQLQL